MVPSDVYNLSEWVIIRNIYSSEDPLYKVLGLY